jgi:prepilin-type N-terminal cleavage/methylation domain-containing protein
MNRKPVSRHRSRGGYTLTELLIVLLIAAILSAMLLPRFFSAVRAMSARSAVSYVVADLALARTQAVREGQTVSLRVDGSTTYRVTLDQGNTIVRTLKTVRVDGQRGVSLTPSGARVMFDSRGMLRGGSATQVIVSRTGKVDTVSISAVGRVYRGAN